MYRKVDKALLRAYFDGVCSESEARTVESWLARTDHTAEDTTMLEDIFNSIRATADSRTRAEYAEVAAAIRRSRRVSWYRRAGYAAAAAVVALFVAVASFDAAEQSVPTETAAPEMLQAYAPCGESLEVSLPDGSVIVLAADSRLTYPASFDGDTRHVELVGECFASIAKNPAKPFILTSGKVDVVVKGTQFNVKSRRSSSEVEVALVEGSVLVENRIGANERILLEPGQLVKIDNTDGSASVGSFDTELYAVSGTSNSLAFVNQRFGDIAASLESAFGVKIEIADAALLNERFYAAFVNNETIDEILSTFNAADTMEITRDGDTVRISLRK